ncbi:hypothetical protein [Kordia sp.]|uniref:hypothetical protein n=1 Tax=Kordia sp. TaxID=1965332 RepID=UPI003B5BDF2B
MKKKHLSKKLHLKKRSISSLKSQTIVGGATNSDCCPVPFTLVFTCAVACIPSKVCVSDKCTN